MKNLILIVFSFFFSVTTAQDFKALCPGPPMGWNSWNYFGKNSINEDIVHECIDAIAESGLKDAGYNFVVVDGGWRGTKLANDGSLMAHPVKFPHGIKPLADYAHSKGLKFGLHTVPGTHDCGGDEVGAYNIEELHIDQFIDWGVDFLKVDRCKLELDCEGNCWTEEKTEEIYRKWRKILDEKGRDIVLSISAYKFREWNPEICNMSRTTGDIGARVSGGGFFTVNDKGNNPKYTRSVLGIAHINNEAAKFAGAGYWNDSDMLAVGDNGLNLAEQQSHFALWCIMSSPLFLGNDPRNMSKAEKNLITNKTAISINQDPTEQGKFIYAEDGVEMWKKDLRNGKSAILVINTTSDQKTNIGLSRAELGFDKGANARDVYTEKKYRLSDKTAFIIDPHDCKFLLVE